MTSRYYRLDGSDICLADLKRFSRPQAKVIMSSSTTITPAIERQAIELPSWALGNSGSGFRILGTPADDKDPASLLGIEHRHDNV